MYEFYPLTMTSSINAITLLIEGEALQRHLFELNADIAKPGFASFVSESSEGMDRSVLSRNALITR